MATGSNRYDHPNYITTRLISLGQSHGPTNGVVQASFVSPVNLRLQRVKGVVAIAGTSSTNTLTIRASTTSIGLLSFDSSAALYVASADLAGYVLTAGTVLNFLKGTDATGVQSLSLEFNVQNGAALTV